MVSHMITSVSTSVSYGAVSHVIFRYSKQRSSSY